ncbi:MAG: O-antigen ligase family protein [Parcubacteria group bacterium]|nr:O-antigen ligase family protein [Parcubacteria group bacterium]
MKWGVYLVCAFLPSYLIRFNAPLAIPMTALELMILILFGIWLIKNITHLCHSCAPKGIVKAGIHKNKLLIIGAGLFLLSATISIFISPDIRAATGIWKAYFIEPILFLIVFLSVIKKKDLKWILYSLGLSALYISLYTIGQKMFGLPIPTPWQSELRVTSIFPFPNAVGLYLAPIIFLLFGQLLKEKIIILKIFLATICTLSITAIYFAKSEGALVAIVAGAILWGLIYNKTSRRITTSIVLLGFVSCILLSSTPLFKEVETKLLLQDWSGKVRLTIWAETWEMIKDKPIFGAGLAGYQTAIIPYHKSSDWMEIFLYPHNIFFNFWTELGVVGLIAFALIILGFYKNSYKNHALIVAITVLLIHGLVDVPYLKNDLSVLFWLIIGISLISDKKR